jgi:hypothetical protein
MGWSASQERPPWRQEGEMAHEVNCPHCGCPLVATEDAVRVPEVDAVETLHREIDHLRATIARLRGAGFNSMHRTGETTQRHPARFELVPEQTVTMDSGDNGGCGRAG